MYGLFVSTAYIGLSLLLGFWARRLLRIAAPSNSLPRQLLEEAIATWELCAACFELVIVADNYGVSTYAVYLFLLTIWWGMEWGDSTACPYTHLEDVVQGLASPFVALLKVWAQLAGGLVVFGYIKYLWSLEITENHKGRAYDECTADLQVPVLFGALIEGIATCMCRISSKTIGMIEPKFGAAVDSFIATSLVVAAFNYSGGYFNPALATSLKFGCRGHTGMEHIIVYWIGSSIGAILSVVIFNDIRFQRILRRTIKKDD